MTSNLVVAGSSPAGGAGQDSFNAEAGPYVGLYEGNGRMYRRHAAQVREIVEAAGVVQP